MGLGMNNLLEEFEAEIIDLMNAYGKTAFLAGFDAGEEETYDGGKIICDDFYKEVTEKRYQAWVNEQS